MRNVFIMVAALCMLTFAAGAQTATTTNFSVSPANPSGWYFYDDTADSTATANGTFVDGPGHPPLGTGSVRLTALVETDRQAIATNAYAGTPIANITNWQYSTYQPGPTLAIALQFDVKYRAGDTAYGGRLVFEPYQQSGTVPSGWSTWNPYNGVWWASKTSPAGSNGACPQSNPCTWASIVSAFPGATISGRLLLRTGGNWTNFVGNADALSVGVRDESGNVQIDTYDFNLHSTPTSMDECKNGGYKNFNPPGGPYKNQGQCVSSTVGNK